MESIKCFVKVNGDRTFLVLVNHSKRGDDGIAYCSYEHFMEALRQHDALKFITEGSIEIFDDDLEDYVVLTKNIAIPAKAKMRASVPDEGPMDTLGGDHHMQDLKDMISLASLNGEASCHGVRDDPMFPRNLPQRHAVEDLDNIADAISGMSRDASTSPSIQGAEGEVTAIHLDENGVADGYRSMLSDDEFDLSSDDEDGEKENMIVQEKMETTTGDENMPPQDAKANDIFTILSDIATNSKAEKLLSKMAPAFAQSYKKFIGRDPWFMELDSKLLSYISQNRPKIEEMSTKNHKTADQIWDHIAAKINHPPYATHKVTPQVCKEFFINDILEYYLDVQINSTSYENSFLLYPKGFEVLYQTIASKPTLLKALGIDLPKTAMLVKVTKGCPRELKRQMRQEYIKWKETGQDEYMKMLGNVIKEISGSSNIKPKVTEKVKSAKEIPSSNMKSHFGKEGKLPPQVWGIVKMKPQKFISLMDELWSRPEDVQNVERILFNHLAKQPNIDPSSAKNMYLSPAAFWDRVTEKVRTELSNQYLFLKPTFKREDIWKAFNKSLDYYIEVCLNVANENDRKVCYPCVVDAMKRIKITEQMGLDLKRTEVLVGIDKKLDPKDIRRMIAEGEAIKKQLGIQGYIMRNTNDQVLGSSQASTAALSQSIDEQQQGVSRKKKFKNQASVSESDVDLLFSDSDSISPPPTKRSISSSSAINDYFLKKMENYRNLPAGDKKKYEILFKYLNDHRDSIVDQKMPRNSEEREKIWKDITKKLESSNPNYQDFKSVAACKKMFRQLMLDCLLVRANTNSDSGGAKAWRFYKYATRLSHNRFLTTLGVSSDFYEAMKAASGFGRASRDHNDLKLKELREAFYIDGIKETESSHSNYSPAFKVKMDKFQNLSKNEKEVYEKLIKLLVNKKEEYLSEMDGSKKCSINDIWNKVADEMNQGLVHPRNSLHYKIDILMGVLDVYEALVCNVTTRGEAAKLWPYYFGIIHNELIDRDFLVKVCDLENQRVNRLVSYKKTKFN